MAEKIFTFDEAGMRTTIKGVRKALGMQGRPIPQPKGPRDEGGGCDSQNAIWDIAILGTPTGGTFTAVVIVNAVSETKTFAYNDSAATVKTTLATHAQIDSADLTVTGTFPNSTMRIEFGGALANKDILQPTTDWSSLTGGTGMGIIAQLAQKGHA